MTRSGVLHNKDIHGYGGGKKHSFLRKEHNQGKHHTSRPHRIKKRARRMV